MFVQRTKILKISLLAIFSAFLVELIFGLVSNSLGLITDSIHALLDSVVTLILLLAARLAIKPPDEEHTYGHGKIESLGGLIGGIAIFLIAIFFIYESIHRLQSPPPSIFPPIFAIERFKRIILKTSIPMVYNPPIIAKIPGKTLGGGLCNLWMDS